VSNGLSLAAYSYVKEIPLTQGFVALVDDVLMHRALLAVAGPVDHTNGDGLDNRRANLRAATCTENARNVRVHRDNLAGWKGVSKAPPRVRARWRARIWVDGRELRLGYFDDPEAAARAYDAAAREYFGAFAALNFPDNPDERHAQ
jgi:hypothetical protein